MIVFSLVFMCSRGQRQQNLDFEEWLLPLVSASFIGSLAEAAKSCFLRQVCCLWPKGVSSGLWQRQQNLDFEECLLPLVSASFIGFLAEAAKSCFLRQTCCLWSCKLHKLVYHVLYKQTKYAGDVYAKHICRIVTILKGCLSNCANQFLKTQ